MREESHLQVLAIYGWVNNIDKEICKQQLAMSDYVNKKCFLSSSIIMFII